MVMQNVLLCANPRGAPSSVWHTVEKTTLPVVAVASSFDPCQQYLQGKLQAKSYPLAKNHGDKGFTDARPRLSEISGINAESFESRV